MNNIQDKPRGRKLTAREEEVLTDIAHGLSTKDIANKYSIAINTAKVHRHNIIKKMRVANTVEAVVEYMRFGKIA